MSQSKFKYKLKEERDILKPNEVDPSLIARLEDQYGPVDMENDFFSRDLKTYFKTDDINKETGSISHKIIKLASFSDSLEKLNTAVDALSALVKSPGGKSDAAILKIFENLKAVFNNFRTHLRKYYPDQYNAIKDKLDEISSISSNSGFTSGGEGENHDGPSPKKSTYGAYSQVGYKKVSEGPGATMGPGPAAGETGVTNNVYVKDFKYKLVNQKALNKKAKGIIVKPLWKENINEANTDVESYLQDLNISDPDRKKFISSRLLGFDELERKLNELLPLLQQAKHKTMDYYRANPSSFGVVYGTDLANDYLNDLIELFKD
jgi:hypothetical protein